MQWEQACREDQKLKIVNQQSHENHFLIKHGTGVVYIQMHVAGCGGGADCKVCFVRREYSVIALFMCGHSLCGYAGHGVNTGEFISPAQTELYSLGGGERG